MPRRRDSLLEALEAFRQVHPAVSVMNLLAFLYVGENEGLNVTELAALCRTTCATASRTVRALAGRDGDGPTLVEVRTNPKNAIGRVIYLTDAGRRLRIHLDQILARRTPIALVGAEELRTAS